MPKSQILADIYGEKLPRWLSRNQREILNSIERPQLKEDVYLAITGQKKITFPPKKELRLHYME